MRTRGYILAILSATFYGLIPLFVLPIMAAGYPLNFTLFMRFMLAALMIAGYLTIKRETLRVAGKEILILAALGLFYALSTHTLFLGYELLSPGIASSILFVFPVLVALIMAIFFKERLGKLSIVSLIISVLGVMVLGMERSLASINFWGILVCLLSALFYAVYIVVVNKAGITASGLKLACYSLFFTGLYFLGRSVIVQEAWFVPQTDLMLNIVMLSLVSTVLCLAALVVAVRIIGSTSTSILSAMEPIVAVAVSVIFFGEDFTISLLVGMTLVIAGVALNILGENRKKA